jgi:hypothetical protein
VETIDYFLKQYRKMMLRKREERDRIDHQLAEYESKLRKQLNAQPRSASLAPHTTSGVSTG